MPCPRPARRRHWRPTTQAPWPTCGMRCIARQTHRTTGGSLPRGPRGCCGLGRRGVGRRGPKGPAPAQTAARRGGCTAPAALPLLCVFWLCVCARVSGMGGWDWARASGRANQPPASPGQTYSAWRMRRLAAGTPGQRGRTSPHACRKPIGGPLENNNMSPSSEAVPLVDTNHEHARSEAPFPAPTTTNSSLPRTGSKLREQSWQTLKELRVFLAHQLAVHQGIASGLHLGGGDGRGRFTGCRVMQPHSQPRGVSLSPVATQICSPPTPRSLTSGAADTAGSMAPASCPLSGAAALPSPSSPLRTALHSEITRLHEAGETSVQAVPAVLECHPPVSLEQVHADRHGRAVLPCLCLAMPTFRSFKSVQNAGL